MVGAIDDELCIKLMLLFNKENGISYLKKTLPEKDREIINKLKLLGISGIANIIGSIKMAKYYEMKENDLMFTIATDSMDMYISRLNDEKED